MPSVQHLGGDTWRVRIPNGHHPVTGKRRTKSQSFTASGVRAAEAKARKIIVAHDAVELERRSHQGSVAQLMDDWLAVKQRTLSPTTLKGYRRRSKVIVAKFGRTPAAHLTGRDIDHWYTALMDSGVSVPEVRHIHLVFRAALKWGYRRGDVESVATDKATQPNYHQPDVRPPTPEVVRMLLDGLPDRPYAQWARAIRVMVFTGMRRGEVCGLRWDGVTSTHLTVMHSVVEVDRAAVVRIPKGKHNRQTPITDPLALVLAEQRAYLNSIGIDSPWVFPDLRADTTGRLPRRPGTLTLAWVRHRKKYGAETVRLHDLRHGWASTMIDQGVPVTTVSRLLGHAQTSTTTDIYGFGTDAGEQLALAAMNRTYSAESPAP